MVARLRPYLTKRYRKFHLALGSVVATAVALSPGGFSSEERVALALQLLGAFGVKQATNTPAP